LCKIKLLKTWLQDKRSEKQDLGPYPILPHPRDKDVDQWKINNRRVGECCGRVITKLY